MDQPQRKPVLNISKKYALFCSLLNSTATTGNRTVLFCRLYSCMIFNKNAQLTLMQARDSNASMKAGPSEEIYDKSRQGT